MYNKVPIYPIFHLLKGDYIGLGGISNFQSLKAHHSTPLVSGNIEGRNATPQNLQKHPSKDVVPGKQGHIESPMDIGSFHVLVHSFLPC